ncbi:unnamed protein product, partial [Polarella glacialis]
MATSVSIPSCQPSTCALRPGRLWGTGSRKTKGTSRSRFFGATVLAVVAVTAAVAAAPTAARGLVVSQPHSVSGCCPSHGRRSSVAASIFAAVGGAFGGTAPAVSADPQLQIQWGDDGSGRRIGVIKGDDSNGSVDQVAAEKQLNSMLARLYKVLKNWDDEVLSCQEASDASCQPRSGVLKAAVSLSAGTVSSLPPAIRPVATMAARAYPNIDYDTFVEKVRAFDKNAAKVWALDEGSGLQ